MHCSSCKVPDLKPGSWIPPDSAEGAQSDVWSLGCILYEMLTFRHPFNGRNTTELYRQVRGQSCSTLTGCWSCRAFAVPTRFRVLWLGIWAHAAVKKAPHTADPLREVAVMLGASAGSVNACAVC